MAENSSIPGTEPVVAPANPLVFLSHDSRDAELAEAFSKLIKSVSAGMIKTFRSSDKKGTEGIDFGEEWYKRLMSALQATSDVVCIFTERSVERPWLLFEAGVAKGKLDIPVIGVACGLPLGRISTGPFYQFQNMDDSEDDLLKLVQQLARRVPGLELDADVARTQVKAFKATEATILKKAATKGSASVEEENPVAKLAEEMKALPARVAERLGDGELTSFRRKGFARLSPSLIDELTTFMEPGDPTSVLVLASIVRDDAPWLYEITREIYQALKSRRPVNLSKEMERIERLSIPLLSRSRHELMDSDSAYVLQNYPRILYHVASRVIATQSAREPDTTKKTTTKG